MHGRGAGRRGVRPWLVLAVAALALTGCGLRQRGAPSERSSLMFDQTDRRLVWPMPIATTARLTSRFGNRKDPFTGLINFHTGVDLDGAEGDPIHAAGAGRVTYAGFRAGFGNLLVVDHGGGLTTWYGHCSAFTVRKGQTVRRGQVVARMGKSGRATGVHLHFETRKHGQPFDPFLLLPKLLPL